MSEPRALERRLGLREATALNMIDMVGIGPFTVMPLVMKELPGAMSLAAWVAGALLAMLDATVWAELGASLPEAGGSFVFLRRIYDPESLGKMMSFLFVWQTTIQAPLVVASGAIGFAQYFGYLYPVGTIGSKCISGLVVIVLTMLLYRSIESVGKITMLLWIGVIGTIIWIVVSGAINFNASLAFSHGATNDLGLLLSVALGHATINTVYSYLGYYNVCHLGSEIVNPGRVIPRSIFLSIIGIALLYIAMQSSVLGVLPWKAASQSQFIFSTFMEHLYGTKVASIATIMILWIAFSSLFAVMLGYSRIPYAAAKDGAFFKIFARVHPTKHFPNVSLIALAVAGFAFSMLFKLSEVITAILAMRIMIQFIGQAIGLMLWRKREPGASRPFRTPLFPLAAIAAIVAWIWLYAAIDTVFQLAGLAMIASGIVIYLIRARTQSEWPFALVR